MTGLVDESTPDDCGEDVTKSKVTSKFLQKKLKLNKLGRVSQFEKFSKYVSVSKLERRTCFFFGKKFIYV